MPVRFGFRLTAAPGAASEGLLCGGVPPISFPSGDNQQGGNNLARSNYQFQKRQKELARKKKKEEKRKRKLEKDTPPGEETPEQAQTE